jgi:hypothetical protein
MRRVVIGTVINLAVAINLAETALFVALALDLLTDQPTDDRAEWTPVEVSVRIDPTLEPTDGVHPTWHWAPRKLFVLSEREDGGWELFAAHRDLGDHRVERVEIRLALGQPTLRAQALARWYTVSGIPLFDDDVYATAIHGAVIVDADRAPADGDERIIAYNLDGLRDGNPVHLEGKIIAGAGELDSMHADR